MFDFSGYDERFKTATYGWRAGLGFNVGNLNLGVEYEGNFSEFGENVTVGGQDFSFARLSVKLVTHIANKD